MQRQPGSGLRPLVMGLISLGAIAALSGGCRGKVSPTSPTPPPPSASPTPYSFLGLPDHDEHRGQLRTYFGQKYSQEEIKAVKSTVEDVLGDYSPTEKGQAAAELLAFNDVVFHITPNHHLELNHKAIRPHEQKLKDVCKQYGVPFLPVLAIVSWENSGNSNKVSWADAAGLGQMTWGAIEQAHRYAEKEAESLAEGDALRKQMLNIEKRHKYLAKLAKQPDERFVPECNLEDVVLFFRYLLAHYGGEVDHAIGAYHKGMGNHDDILRDYIQRKEGSCPDPIKQRNAFIEAMRRQHITYLTLWNDKRSREMLNGLRTLDGDPRTRQNASQALGDESDIYPWKVLGSLTAYRQGPEYVEKMQAKYHSSQVEVEVAGLNRYTSAEAIAKATGVGDLVRTRLPLTDLGVDANVSQAHRDMAYSITPELEGYLWGLTQRWRQRATNSQLRLPVVRLLAVGDLAGGHRSLYDQAQLRGVTVQLQLQDLPEKDKEALQREIEEDYLLDRVYRTPVNQRNVLLCLNPRFGHEFIELYEKYKRGGELALPHSDEVRRVAASPTPLPTADGPPPNQDEPMQPPAPSPTPSAQEQPKSGAEL